MKLFIASRSVAKLDYTTVRLPFTLLEECVISEMYSVLGEAADRRGDRIASFHIDAASTSAFTGSYREPVPATPERRRRARDRAWKPPSTS